MKKEFFDFVWKVIDKFGYPVLGAFILSIVTLVIAPDKYVEMVPFPDNKIYWACAILVVLYTLIFAASTTRKVRNAEFICVDLRKNTV